MILSGRNTSTRTETVLFTKSHMNWSGIEPGLPRWGQRLPPELWRRSVVHRLTVGFWIVTNAFCREPRLWGMRTSVCWRLAVLKECCSATDCSYRLSQCVCPALTEGTPAWTELYPKYSSSWAIRGFRFFIVWSWIKVKLKGVEAGCSTTPSHVVFAPPPPPASFIFPPSSLCKMFWSFVACAVGQLDMFCFPSKCVTRTILRIYTFLGCDVVGWVVPDVPTFRFMSSVFRVGI
jgi:hypothetical protein